MEKLIKFFKALANLNKIKEYAVAILLVVVKLSNVLDFLEEELEGTTVGDKLKDVLPKLQGAVAAIVKGVSKVLELFGESVPTEFETQSSDIDKELEELTDAVNELKSL